MTKAPITPWSQLDDDLDDRPDAAAHGAGAPAKVGAADRSWDGEASAVSPIRRWLLGIDPYWALIPLTGAVVWLAWVTARMAAGKTPPSWLHLLGVLGVILGAGAMLLAIRRGRRSTMALIRSALSRNDPRAQNIFESLPVAPELQPVWQAVKQHAANIEQRVAELVQEHTQIGLEFSFADTQRRQAEAIIHCLPEPLLVVDSLDQLILANATAETLFGFDRKQALRRPLDEVIHDEKLVRMIRQAREAGSRAANRRAEHDIASRSYAVLLTPLSTAANSATGPEGAGGDAHGVIVFLRDITKDREAAKMKSEFVARAAHELRTPLSSIRAYAEMLVDGEAADEKTRKEYYEIIQTSADRLGRMIDNVLNISRIEAGTVRSNKEPVAVSVVAKEAIDAVRPQAEQKGLTLTQDLSPVAYRVMADRDMIYQAILNLLSNAIKYTPAGGSVRVKMTPHEENRTINIEVADTGVGIPPEDLPRMFEKFFRVEVNKKIAKGTGLGLNLVKHIVETIHEGKVTLASEVGRGSTFGMILPLCS